MKIKAKLSVCHLRLFLLGFLLIQMFSLMAGEPIPDSLIQKALEDQVNIKDYTEWRIGSGKILTFEKVTNDTNFNSFGTPFPKGKNYDNLWIKFRFESPQLHSPSDTILFYWAGFSMAELNVYENFNQTSDTGELIQKSTGGIFRGSLFSSYPRSRDFLPIYINSNKLYTVYVKLGFVEGVELDSLPENIKLVSISTEAKMNNHYLINAKNLNFVFTLTKGILFFIFIITLAQFFITKDRTYLSYSGYAFANLFYFQLIFETIFTTAPTFIFLFSKLPYYLLNPILIFSYILYFEFIKRFLNLKNNNSRLYQLFNQFTLWLLIGIGLDLLVHLLFGNSKIYSIAKFSILGGIILIALFGLYKIIKQKDILSKIVITGSIFLAIGQITGFFMLINGLVNTQNVFVNGHFYTMIGVLLEMLFFFTGLGYRTKLLEDQNIKQLNINQQLEKEKLVAETEKDIANSKQREAEKEKEIATLKQQETEKEIEIEILKRKEAEQAEELATMQMKSYTEITHEFRTPLHLILSYTKELMDAFPTPNHKLEVIKNNGETLLHLVNKILLLKKLQVSEVKPQLIQGNIANYIKVQSEAFRSLATDKSIILNISEPDEIFMDYDPQIILSIVNNLISNALKFSDRSDEVNVSVKKTNNNELELKVKDTGIGIPPERMDDIFKPFVQLGQLTRERGQGSGIGLPLVKEYVKLLRGNIELTSTLGKGTEVLITLPIENNMPLVEPSNSPINYTDQYKRGIMDAIPRKYKIPSIIPGRPVILLVEDNKSYLEWLESKLKNKYQVITAIDGLEGLETAKNFLPDLVISDIAMPKMNGLDLCEILKTNELTDHISIILLTAKNDYGSNLKGIQKQANAYFSKPLINEPLFFAKIENLILETQKKKIGKDKTIVVWREKIVKGNFEKNVFEALEANYHKPEFTVALLARELALGEKALRTRFNESNFFIETPGELLRDYRMVKARQFIWEDPYQTIQETAEKVGYNSGNTNPFSQAYTNFHDESPKETMEKVKKSR